MLIPPSGQVWKSYYFQGSVRIAMRVQVNGAADQVFYLLTDHLGSTSITVDTNNSKQAELRFAPWGTTRYAWGETPTDYRYTGQREEEGIGLYYYQARFYDANLGRFSQADTLIPEQSQGVQAWDRFAYVNNNPLLYNDPGGHKACIDDDCLLAENPVSGRIFLNKKAPPIISYIYGEMKRNAMGNTTKAINYLNYSYNHPISFVNQGYQFVMARGLWASQVMDARIKGVSGPFAPLLGNWDHKPEINKNYAQNGYTNFGSQSYRMDIWSNIHYGYVGRAAGFSTNELTGGAGIEQIGSDIFSRKQPNSSPGADNKMSAFDDPSDNAAIQIGITLWNEKGIKMTEADLIFAIFLNDRLAAHP